MVVRPRETLTAACAEPASLATALIVLVVAAAADLSFLATDVGRLAALDQGVRQLESVGIVVTDEMYGRMLAAQPYQPVVRAAVILVGWPLGWLVLAWLLRAVYERRGAARASFWQVHTLVVHAAVVLAVRAVVAWPLNYARESLGGATTLGALFPVLSESSVVARLLGAVDLFALWGIALLALGLSILYERRPAACAKWLVGAYAAAALVLAVTQAIRGGV
jgi:hypothetical protein